MAKYFGNAVKTGKLGGSVFAIRNGETIERQYQPVVANPSTPDQVEARAKLKMLSQLSAVMAPVIAIRKQKNVSSRNLFVKKNYPQATFLTDTASIPLASIQLTSSVVAIPEVTANRSEGGITAQMSTFTVGFDSIVYAMFIKQADDTLRYDGSRVISEAGVDGNYPATFGAAGGNEVVILAYGVRNNTEAARAVYSDMQTITAETVAKLIVNRVLSEADITLSETRGVQLAAI